ncbi:hypothetical protein ACHAWX_000226 [Stephanocyclus meneghinianus]
MKRKKIHEQELDKLQHVKFTMETQIMKIESAIDNKEMYEALVAGSSTMKKLQGNLGVNEVDNVIDAIREALEDALDINASLAQDVNPLSLDDDDLLAELMETDYRTNEHITSCQVRAVGNPSPSKKVSHESLDLPIPPLQKLVSRSDANAVAMLDETGFSA